MATRRRSRSRRTVARRRPTRRRRRNAYVAPRRRRRRRAVAANPPVRRRRRRAPSRRRRRNTYRRNPQIMGISLPPMSDVLWGTAGVAAIPTIEGFATPFLPTALTGNTMGRYAVKGGALVLASMATRALIGSSEAKKVALGGSLYIVVNAIIEFAPGVIPGLGAYVPVRRAMPASNGNSLRAYTPYRQLGYAGGGVPVAPNGGNSTVATSRYSRY